jgi:hypothetical protein
MRRSSATCLVIALLPLHLLGCGGTDSGGNAAAEARNEAAAEGAAAPVGEADAAALAEEAAADEAADTNTFGGNAASGETGNTQ